MSVQVENLEKSMAKLTVEVSAEELEKALQGAYLKQKKNISIPGFRKGKVPRVMIEKMYGPSVFYEDAANALLPEAYSKAADESGLDIVSRPDIDVVQLEKGKTFIFTAEVAVKPPVTLGQYKGLEVPKSDLTVSEEEVEAELKKEQEKNGRMIDVDDRPAQKGDTVTLDYAGTVDGVAFDGGTATSYPLVLGSGSFIPGFEDQLEGVSLGEEKEVHVTFPEDYHAEDLKGKEAVFTCTIQKISRRELPELDDDFAMDVSDFDTLEEYKADLRQELEKKKEESAKRSKEDAAVQKAVENASMELPQAMISTQAEQQVENFARRIQMQGMKIEQYLQYTGQTLEGMRKQMEPQAIQQIQTRLVLEAIAKAEDIQISEEKLAEELEKMAKMYGMEVDKLKEIMGDKEMDQLKEDLAVQEAVTFVADQAVEVEAAEEKAEEAAAE